MLANLHVSDRPDSEQRLTQARLGLVDPARQLAAVDTQPAHRLRDSEAVHAARARLKLVEEADELALGISASATVVEEWL